MAGHAPWNITNTDEYYLFSMAKNIGWVATRFYDIPMRDMMHELYLHIENTPNVSNRTIQEFLGANDFYWNWLEVMLGGAIEFRVEYFEERQPFMPSERLDNQIWPVIVPFLIISTIALALRFYSRKTLIGRIRGYDWVILAAFIFLLGLQATIMYYERNLAMFQRIWDQSYNLHSARQPFVIAIDALYYVTAALVKVSLLLFYYSLTGHLVFRSINLYMIFCCITLAVASVCLVIFACTPIAVWEDLFGGYCPIDRLLLNYSVGSINIFMDVLIWVMPLPLVWHLQLTKREKFLAFFTFGLGALACIACGFRLKAVTEGYFVTNGKTGKVDIYRWTVIELNLAVICASAPALRALAIAYWPKIVGDAKPTAYSTEADSSLASNGQMTSIQINHPFKRDQLEAGDFRKDSEASLKTESPTP